MSRQDELLTAAIVRITGMECGAHKAGTCTAAHRATCQFGNRCPAPTAEDRAALARAEERRTGKRADRARLLADGSPPPEGGATGRSVTFTAELEEP